MLRQTCSRLPRQVSRAYRGVVVSRSSSISTTALRMTPILNSVEPPMSKALPSDSFHLLSTADKTGEAEDRLYDEQLEDVKRWWASPRYEGIKRPYTADDVVSKRGSLQITYPSSIMARKLFNLLNERAATGEPVHTSELLYSRGLPPMLMRCCSGCH